MITTKIIALTLFMVASVPQRASIADFQRRHGLQMEFIDYELINSHGDSIKISDFNGKVVFLDFWFTGCAGCKLFYANVLKHVKEDFKDEKDVVFLSISIDKDEDKWLESVASGAYTDGTVVNLYTGDKGAKHPLIASLQIKSYPGLFILDREGKVFNDNSSLELRRTRNNKLEHYLKLALAKR